MINYKYINMDYLTEMSSGDNDFVMDMINDWIVKLPIYLSDLLNATVNKNKEDIRFFSHKLHSSFYIIGAFDLAKICTKIEELAKNDADMEELENRVNQIMPIYNCVVIEIKEELKQLSSN